MKSILLLRYCGFVMHFRDLDDIEYQDEKRERVFKIMTAKKSFYVKAKTVELKLAWLSDLQKFSRLVVAEYYFRFIVCCQHFQFVLIYQRRTKRINV
jgi:hypothetical protein